MALWNRCSICGRDIPVGERCYGVKKSGESICFDCIELENASAEGISKSAFEQVVWERDTALRQLREDYGVGLGEKKRDVAGVRHGEWIGRQLDDFKKYESTCSECGWVGIENYDSYNDPSDFNYCPNCGAIMDGEQQEETP